MHSINIRFLHRKIQEMEVWLHGRVIDLACTRVCIQASVAHTHTHTEREREREIPNTILHHT